jgi:hypothetical protein
MHRTLDRVIGMIVNTPKPIAPIVVVNIVPAWAVGGEAGRRSL